MDHHHLERMLVLTMSSMSKKENMWRIRASSKVPMKSYGFSLHFKERKKEKVGFTLHGWFLPENLPCSMPWVELSAIDFNS